MNDKIAVNLSNLTEVDLDVLHQIDLSPNSSQRKLASTLGVSLGKINYCIQALIQKGFIKLGNFSKSNNKMSYAYFLTPKGVVAKIVLTKKFLAIKQAEYEKLYNYINY